MPSFQTMQRLDKPGFIPPEADDDFDLDSTLFGSEEKKFETESMDYFRCKLCPSNWLDMGFIHDHCEEPDHVTNVEVFRRYRLQERLYLLELAAWKNMTIALYHPKTRAAWKNGKAKVRMNMDKSDNAIVVIATAVKAFIDVG